MGELSGKKIDLLVASERDPLTPVDTVRPYAYTIADRGAKVMLATYDGGYINELNTTQVPAHSAGHLLIYHPEVQKFVLSRLLEN
jgi:hypothetical protein